MEQKVVGSYPTFDTKNGKTATGVQRKWLNPMHLRMNMESSILPRVTRFGSKLHGGLSGS